MTRRIHIVGSSPRTGTTLLAELMRNAFAIDAAVDHELSIFKEWPKPCAVHLSKNPGDIVLAASVLAADPRVWILHMVRDPRDVVVSRHDKAPEKYWTHLGLWQLYRRAARRAEGHPRFLTLRYEDLVRTPDRVQEEIAAFLPFLRRRCRFSEVQRFWKPSQDSLVALGGDRPVSTSSIGAWRDHRPRLRAQLERHGSIDRDLVDLGYESDDAWKRMLDGVAADNGQTFLAEPIGLRRRWRLWRRRTRRYWRWRLRLRRRLRDETPAATGPFQIEGLRLGEALIEIGSLGEGPRVVCLPSEGSSGTVQYGALAEELAGTGFRCIAVNPRGVGASRGPLEGITLRELARDVAELIAHEGPPAHVIGAAFGNRVARYVASAYPDRVRSVTLLAAGGLVPPRARRPARRKRPRRPWPLASRGHRRAGRATPLDEWWAGGSAPTLVIQGLEDEVAVPENGRRLARDHPDRVRLLELEGAGHHPLRDRPDRVIPAVLAFLREIEARSTAPRRSSTA